MGFLQRLVQTDEERLAEEIREWAESVPGTTRIAECPSRKPVRVAGVVQRLTIRPREDCMEAVISDGTGEVTAVWTGRSHIPGLSLGSRVILEGVLSSERGRVRVVNPRYEFA
jgi:OB-fold nucleic acid binding protein